MGTLSKRGTLYAAVVTLGSAATLLTLASENAFATLTAQSAPIVEQPDSNDASTSAQTPDSVTNDRPVLLLVEPEYVPEVTLTWHSKSRGEVRYTRTSPYAIDSLREPVGDNVEIFAAVGGTRISKAAGHPNGSVIKAGFYKGENGIPWFDDIDTAKPITVSITGMKFNQPVHVPVGTTLLHSKYALEDLESCGLPGDARECFATGSRIENLNRRVRPGVDTRLGALSESGPGSVEISIDDEGLVSVVTTFPYAVLRNLQDPWMSELPGTFLEPYHFHFELEALPEGVEPLDWVQLGLNSDALTERLEREGSLSVPNSAFPPEAPEGFVPQPRDPYEPFKPTPADEAEDAETETETET